MAASLGIPRLVSMRGMLEPWAMQHKRWKKRMAWHLYQRRDLASAQYHHATSAKESSGVQRLRLGVPVGVIPNGVDLPLRDHHGGLSRAALFLGRLYPVKGLPMLVEAWARVRPQGWTLRIAGPDEAGHRAHLEKSVSAAGLGAEITFLGPLEGAAKSEAFSEAQLFVLPSHSESFGMAVGEALAHGLPVLTTTAVPWPLLPVRGCGWQVAPTVEGIAEGLSGATSLTPAALAAMGANGRELVAAEFGWERVAAQFLQLYGELAAGTASGPMKRQGQE
jgi:glycosyltransferase involved in cell wall biosynthesis